MFNNSNSNNRSTTGGSYDFSVNDVCDRLEKEFTSYAK